jgi:hypothetical protein
MMEVSMMTMNWAVAMRPSAHQRRSLAEVVSVDMVPSFRLF